MHKNTNFAIDRDHLCSLLFILIYVAIHSIFLQDLLQFTYQKKISRWRNTLLESYKRQKKLDGLSLKFFSEEVLAYLYGRWCAWVSLYNDVILSLFHLVQRKYHTPNNRSVNFSCFLFFFFLGMKKLERGVKKRKRRRRRRRRKNGIPCHQ